MPKPIRIELHPIVRNVLERDHEFQKSSLKDTRAAIAGGSYANKPKLAQQHVQDYLRRKTAIGHTLKTGELTPHSAGVINFTLQREQHTTLRELPAPAMKNLEAAMLRYKIQHETQLPRGTSSGEQRTRSKINLASLRNQLKRMAPQSQQP